MANCLTVDEAADFAARDADRIKGRIAQHAERTAPYLNVLESDGYIDNNEGINFRSIVQERAYMAHSLTEPEFVDDGDVCGTMPDADETGSTVYSYGLKTLRGRGGKVCRRTARTAYPETYRRMRESLVSGITQLKSADVRAVLLRQSGHKMVVRTGTQLSGMIFGGEAEIDTPFYDGTTVNQPNAFPTMALIRAAMTHMRENTLVTPFGDGATAHFRLIGSTELNDALREQSGVREEVLALAGGADGDAKNAIKSYEWTFMWRGLKFGYDNQPLRARGIIQAGVNTGLLDLVPPVIKVAADNGVKEITNPEWITAPYEVAFLMGSNSFYYKGVKSYNGEDQMKYKPQFAGGDLQWFSPNDSCDPYGDYGMFLYEISRAIRPERPHAVCPIVYKRCLASYGLETCTGITGTTGSLVV